MIAYLTGDATCPQGDGLKVICHICNDRGAWGKGFVLALSRRWLEPERLYREHPTHALGEVIFATVEDDVMVANLVAQRGFPTRENPVAVDYVALEECLGAVAAFCREQDASAHMPLIGCGIGGGNWTAVAEIIDRTLVANGIPVTVYSLPKGTR